MPSKTGESADDYKFWSLAGAPFNNSVYTPYVTKILDGLKLSNFGFEYSVECSTQFQNLLTQIYYIVRNGTCYEPYWNIQRVAYYSSQVASTEFANSFYKCYLFVASVQKVATERFSKFTDFTDLYTSFLFNLLSQSLSIRNLAVNI